MQSKQGKNGGTYAHPEIACAFCAWLHPEFHYSLIQSFLATHQRWRLSISNQRAIIEIPARIAEAQDRAEKLRVAAYCRVSTSQEAQQNSYQAQRAYYLDRIESNPDWVLADIFADEAISGTSVDNRTEFQRMIRWCKKGKIDLILTKSISRFARNTEDCLHYVRLLKDLQIPVIFETEWLDTFQMDSEFFLAMLGANSQAESEATSSRVKWGVRAAFRDGKVRYQYKRWLGYRKGEDGNPEIVPEEAAVVRKIFDAYLAGQSLKAIKHMLEEEKISTKTGLTEWSVPSIQNILKNACDKITLKQQSLDTSGVELV